MLTCDYPIPPDLYNDRAEEHLRFTGFYHASQIGIVQCQKVLVNVLVERWHPDTHTFHLSIGECAVTLEDVALILGLPTDGLPVTWMTMSNFKALEAECLYQFGVTPRKSDYRGSCIKLSWLRDLKECLQLTDENSIRESNCINEISHIMWRNWERGDRRFRYLTLAHFRKAFDDLQEGQFVWVTYAVDRVDLDIIPVDIYMHSVVWSVTVSLVSFECIEWHATDWYRRQFGFVQVVPHQERDLDKAHSEVRTSP
ncbi:serine/threonine-protein phosphatase 7 long form homolog [Arachis hypogaea]|uniref:serine/threonine-protein phosphatase 7 long form homolog n=1 Tax=Arachis hypogaea TaxID=3818 RepID=UPI003B21F24C